MNRSEFATYLFYLWERRGRGALVYDFPVCLEPPFIPFIREFPHMYGDESKKPTWLSNFFDGLRGKKSYGPEEAPMLDYESIEPFEYESPHDSVAFRIYPTNVHDKNHERMRVFLTMLTNSTSNLSFEIFGNGKEITMQLVCSLRDAPMVETYFASFFPEAVIQQHNDLESILLPERETYALDFCLAEEWVRPLALKDEMKVDSYMSLFGILERVEDGEIAGIQILFQGAVNNWSGSMMAGVTASDGTSFFADAPEAPKITQVKCASPLFAVSVRVFSQEKKGKSTLIHMLAEAVPHITKGAYNRMTLHHSLEYDADTKISDIYLRESHTLGMLLSLDELLTLVHLPLPEVSLKIIQTHRKTVRPPEIFLRKDSRLGINTHLGETVVVGYGIEERLKHTHIIGATGVGKSTLLVNLIVQDIQRGHGVLVLDPHGDLITDVISHIPKERYRDIILYDPSDADFPIGLNIMEARSDHEKEILASDIVASFRKLSTSWGDQMNTVFSNALLAFLESSEGGTLSDVRRFLVDSGYRKECIKKIQDPSIVFYWEREYPLLKTNSIGPILTRLDTFLRPRVIRNSISQQSGLNFQDIIEKQKILLVPLSLGSIGRENSYLLGSLFISKIHLAALARSKKQNRTPFFLYMDEFHHFITPSIVDMITGVRKFGLGLVLAHQHLGQLEKEGGELLHTILGNIGTRIVFRIGEHDAKKLEAGFTGFEASDMENLGTGEGIVRIGIPKQTTSFETVLLSKIPEEEKEARVQEVRTHTRKHYAVRKEIIEELLRTSFDRHISDTKERETKTPAEVLIDPTEEQRQEERSVALDSEYDTPSQKPSPNTEPERKKTTTHHYLQELIKHMAESLGYVAVIEARVGMGNIDVLLKKDAHTIAVEISVTTEQDWEVHNIVKCYHAGIHEIVSVSGDKKNLEAIKKKLGELHPEITNVSFHTPDVFFEYLQSKTETKTIVETGQKTMKGYRINVTYDSISKEDMKQKKSTVAKVIMDRMKKNK